MSKHTLVESVQPPELMAPLQLVDGSLRSEQIADNNAFTHMMKNTQKIIEIQMSTGSRKPTDVQRHLIVCNMDTVSPCGVKLSVVS